MRGGLPATRRQTWLEHHRAPRGAWQRFRTIQKPYRKTPTSRGGLAAGERSLRPNNNNEPSQIMWHKLLALFALGMAALASTEAARYIVTCDSSSMDSEGLHSLASNLAANYDTDVLAVYGARLSMHHC